MPVGTTMSASTMFRYTLLDQDNNLIRQGLAKLKPVLWLRDRKKVKQIEQAKTAEALLDLSGQATGLADETWFEQMRRFGPEILPLISERLKKLKDISDTGTQDTILEKLIAELRWRGEAGGEVLLDCFDNLPPYGRCLACIVIGRLNMQSGADKVWAFYRQSFRYRGESFFIGALWGLIDLRDERVSEALADLLRQQNYFYELFGFVALAGDARSVVLLLQAAMNIPRKQAIDPSMALVSVAHRIGREALLVELKKATPRETRAMREVAADGILSKPASYAEAHFELFYQGFTAEDLERNPRWSASRIPG